MNRSQYYRRWLMRNEPVCHYCGCLLVTWRGEGTPPNCYAPHGHGYATLDHKDARANGGKDSKRNMVLCCSVCNYAKGSKFTYAEFMALTHERRQQNARTR